VPRRSRRSTTGKDCVESYKRLGTKIRKHHPPPQHKPYKENFNGIDNHDQFFGHLSSLRFLALAGRFGRVFLLKPVINACSVYCEYLCRLSLGEGPKKQAEVRSQLPTMEKFLEMFIDDLVSFWWDREKIVSQFQ